MWTITEACTPETAWTQRSRPFKRPPLEETIDLEAVVAGGEPPEEQEMEEEEEEAEMMSDEQLKAELARMTPAFQKAVGRRLRLRHKTEPYTREPRVVEQQGAMTTESSA